MASDHLHVIHDCTQPGRVSSGFTTGGNTGVLSGRPVDPMAYRRVFRDRWATFLRSHFQSTAHVAVFFDIDEKTARQWWNYVTEPKGWAVSYARDNIPGARAHLMGEAA